MARNDEDKHSYQNGISSIQKKTTQSKQTKELHEFPIYLEDKITGFIQLDPNKPLPSKLIIRDKIYKIDHKEKLWKTNKKQ